MASTFCGGFCEMNSGSSFFRICERALSCKILGTPIHVFSCKSHNLAMVTQKTVTAVNMKKIDGSAVHCRLLPRIYVVPNACFSSGHNRDRDPRTLWSASPRKAGPGCVTHANTPHILAVDPHDGAPRGAHW